MMSLSVNQLYGKTTPEYARKIISFQFLKGKNLHSITNLQVIIIQTAILTSYPY